MHVFIREHLQTHKEIHYLIGSRHSSASLAVCRGRTRSKHTHLKRTANKTVERKSKKSFKNYRKCVLSSLWFSPVKDNIKPQVSLRRLFSCFHVITMSYGTQVLHLSLHLPNGCQYPDWLHLYACAWVTQTEASRHRKQQSKKELLLPPLAGDKPLKIQFSYPSAWDTAVSFLPVACRHAVDCCSQRMSAVASDAREIWEKEKPWER